MKLSKAMISLLVGGGTIAFYLTAVVVLATTLFVTCSIWLLGDFDFERFWRRPAAEGLGEQLTFAIVVLSMLVGGLITLWIWIFKIAPKFSKFEETYERRETKSKGVVLREEIRKKRDKKGTF